MIILRQKVDSNWYQGEANGVIGIFPLSYVQVGTFLNTYQFSFGYVDKSNKIQIQEILNYWLLLLHCFSSNEFCVFILKCQNDYTVYYPFLLWYTF